MMEAPEKSRVIQRCSCGGKCAECQQKRLLQTKAFREQEPSNVALEMADQVVRGTGQSLDPRVQQQMEAKLGHNLGHVRIHADDAAGASASALAAEAYTVGSHIVFGQGKYRPTTREGQELLAHELTHVVQQRNTSTSGPLQLGDQDGAPERQAQSVAKGGRSAAIGSISGNGAVQKQEGGPPPPPTAALGLTVHEDGKVDVTVAGPDNPVVSQPTIGIRKLPGAKYDLLIGGRGTVVGASEIPGILRGAMGQSTKDNPILRADLRMPTCKDLTSIDGTRYQTYLEYKLNTILRSNLPMGETMYDMYIGKCPKIEPQPKMPEIPKEILPKGDFPLPTPGTEAMA